jgi:predicted molibdopterin-dependent oxidoreductase YjgC
LVTLTIDGTVITSVPEATILEAAQQAGIAIPHLCYHPKLRPIGSCRLCVVEIAGVGDPMAACTTPVQEGITVTTRSPQLERLRKEAIQYILINHPLECPVCDKAGECRLQDLCHEFGITEQPFTIEGAQFQTDYASPLIEKHDARCVLCGRCVSICAEVQGVHAIDFVSSGYQSRIGTVSGGKLDCEWCGQCVAICPVGAFIDKLFKYKARAWELTKVNSVCPYCGTGCALELNVKDNRIVRVTSDDEATANRGNLCIRGSFGYGFVHNQDRLRAPLIKKGGRLTATSWDAALDFAADSLKALINAHGPECIAGLGSPHASNEDNYLFQKIFRVTLGNNNIDSVARFGILRGIIPLHSSLGFPASTNSFAEIEQAQSIFIIGSDFSAEMPVASLPVIKAARDNDARLIVASPRDTKLDAFATTKLRYRPQTEAMLLAGLIKVIIDCGLENRTFIENHTDNFAQFKDSAAAVSLETVAAQTGVPVHVIEKAAREIATPAAGAIICGDYLLKQNNGEQAMHSVINMLLLTGHLGREGCGCFLAAGRNNLQGLCDMGVMADMLPGYRGLSDNEDLKKLWQKDVPAKPGVKADELIEAIEQGRIKGLYLMGCDPLTSFFNSHRTRAALEKLELLLVQNLFCTEAASLAHVVLPAASFAEREGSVTSGERRIQWMYRALAPHHNALPDWQIIQQLSQRFSQPMAYQDAWDIFLEIEKAVPQYRGAQHLVKKRNGVQWPVAEDGTGTSFLGKSGICGRFFTDCVQPSALAPDEEFPFILISGSCLYHCGTLSTFAEGPLSVRPSAWAEIHPQEGRRLNIQEQDMVVIRSRQGEIICTAALNSLLPEGVVFVPDHFRDTAVNKLTSHSPACQVNIQKKP